MNQKYEDLLYQAGLTASGCWDELGTYEQEAIEKFAELIVRECMSIVENYPIDPEDMPYNGRIIPYMIFVQEKMQLHFGVEL